MAAMLGQAMKNHRLLSACVLRKNLRTPAHSHMSLAPIFLMNLF
jgi:hypothetical protein